MGKLIQIAGTSDAVLKLLAYHEKLLRQITVASNISFDPYYETLREEVLTYIGDERKFHLNLLAERLAEKNGVEGVQAGAGQENAPAGDVAIPVSLNVSNQQYAVHVHVFEAMGIFKGLQKDIIAISGRLFRSNKNVPLAGPTHEQNVKAPELKPVVDAYETHIRIVDFMNEKWGDKYGLPNLTEMTPAEKRKYFATVKSRSSHQKRGF